LCQDLVGSEQLSATFILFLQAAFMITDHPGKELQAVTHHQALCILVEVHRLGLPTNAAHARKFRA